MLHDLTNIEEFDKTDISTFIRIYEQYNCIYKYSFLNCPYDTVIFYCIRHSSKSFHSFTHDSTAGKLTLSTSTEKYLTFQLPELTFSSQFSIHKTCYIIQNI